MWRALRIAVLSVVLFVVAAGAWSDRRRTTAWDETLWIGIFPVNGDGQPATGRYIAGLDRDQFEPIGDFLAREGTAWGLALDRPVKMVLYPEVAEPPPRHDRSAGVLDRVWWSLKLRWYTWRQAGDTPADIRVFVLYHDPDRTAAVPHSLGLQAGLLGVVYAWADPALDEPNNVVIAHEVLHTVGATDKYDPATNLPLFPQGYGDPEAQPLLPQDTAEIMAGRIATSDAEATMPESLDQVVVGPETAAEILWTE
ncbi:MAG: hypothetical protein J0M16_10315 [Gammaproteobacteria bacterium]|nr:hypothetical protein [Gammaproteobacteria bacterium]